MQTCTSSVWRYYYIELIKTWKSNMSLDIHVVVNNVVVVVLADLQ